MKEAIIRITDDLAAAGLGPEAGGARLIAQLHDEVIFEVPDDKVQEVARLVVARMERPGEILGYALPLLPVSIVAGRSWGAMGSLEESGGGA